MLQYPESYATFGSPTGRASQVRQILGLKVELEIFQTSIMFGVATSNVKELRIKSNSLTRTEKKGKPKEMTK